MKTTIKLTRIKALIVEPCANADLISVSVRSGAEVTSTEASYLTPDQAGALIFGLEQALEVMAARATAALVERADFVRRAGALDIALRKAASAAIRQQYESECG